MIEAIIFDLGGVFLNLDFSRTRQAFGALGTQRFDRLWSPLTQSPFFEAYERGEIDTQTFRDEMRAHLQLDRATDSQLDEAWNAMLGDIPVDRLQWLQGLSGRYRVFMLSNTNAMHMQHIEKNSLPQHTHPRLADYFEKSYCSFEIGARKPEPAAFAHVMQDSGLSLATTLFVDDLPLNIAAAKTFGLHATLLAPHMHLSEVLPTS